MTREEFQRLRKDQQVVLLRDLGVFLANREHGGFIASLFELEGYYVEVWKRIGMDYIDYVEVVKDHAVLQQYLSGFNVRKELDL